MRLGEGDARPIMISLNIPTATKAILRIGGRGKSKK